MRGRDYSFHVCGGCSDVPPYFSSHQRRSLPSCRRAWSSGEALSGNCPCQGTAARLNEVDGERELQKLAPHLKAGLIGSNISGFLMGHGVVLPAEVPVFTCVTVQLFPPPNPISFTPALMELPRRFPNKVLRANLHLSVYFPHGTQPKKIFFWIFWIWGAIYINELMNNYIFKCFKFKGLFPYITDVYACSFHYDHRVPIL